MNTIAPMMFLLSFTVGQGHVCDFRHDGQFGGLFYDCRGRNLTSIPDDVPQDVVALDLRFNSFTRLLNATFIKYPLLVYLNLDDNSISRMEPDAFTGVPRLTQLHLSWNKLSHNKHSFPEHVFRYLTNLRLLTLEMNVMTSYPDWVFPPLRNLTHLYIDSVALPVFGPGFEHLTSLRYLQMDSASVHNSQCFSVRLVNKTFEVFRNISIKMLHMKCPTLVEAEDGVFQPLLALTSLTFSRNCIGVDQNLHILWPFVGRKFKKIDMGAVLPASIKSLADARVLLTIENTKYLKDVCLEEFMFNENHLFYMENNALMSSSFSACIQHFDLSDNNFLGDERILLQLSRFPELIYFSVRRANTQFKGVSFRVSDTHFRGARVFIFFPAKLQYIDLSGITGRPLSEYFNVRFVNATNVKTFIFSNNYNYLGDGRGFTGLENVEVLDISNSILGLVNSQIFKSFPKVRKLYVRACNMRFDENSQLLFDNLSHLEYIDISENVLTVLPNFSHPFKLDELNVSKNAFDNVPISLNDFTNMTTLDMSFNLITHLDSRTRNQLDEAYSMRNLQLRLNGNIFSCGCDNLEFILWLVESQVVFETNRNFSCVQEAGIRMGTLDVARNYLKISRHCNGRYLLSYVITCLTILLGSISTVNVVARNPARYKQLLHKVFGFGHLELITTDFHYQLYVAYCELNIPFVFRKLRPALELGNEPVRLFLKDRDVLPGVDVADGIVIGVNGSFRSLLAVSKEFLEDRWCQFSINVVVNSMNPLVPNRTILLLLDDVQLVDLPESLLNAVDEDFILKVGNYENREASLWRRVRELACI